MPATQYFIYTDTSYISGLRLVSGYTGGDSITAPAADSAFVINSQSDKAFLVQGTPVPAPLPIFGAAAFCYSRKLRKRIKGGMSPVTSA